jgi:PKD repeat protein
MRHTTKHAALAVIFATALACGDESLNEVENNPPVAKAGVGLSTEAGALVAFDGSESTDPDGDELTFEWDFGDGQSADGVEVSHIYNNGGSFVVKLKVTDPLGLSDEDTIEITVTENAPPVAVVSAPDTAQVGQSIRFDGTGSSDSDGTISSWTWDFGDGTQGTGDEFDHEFEMAGSYTVKLTVKDDGGAVGEATHTIAVEEGPATFSGTWNWFLVDDSQRDLGLLCGTFEDSTLLIDTDNAPSMTITEQAGGFTATYTGSIDSADNSFETLYSSFGVEQHIDGTFTSATTFEGWYRIVPLSSSCEDRAVTGIKQSN